MSADAIRNQLVDICHRLSARGFVTATDGNVSARLGNGNFLTTRTAVGKGMVTPADILEVDAQGKPLSEGARPSTELGMHLFIYSRRPDINAVVHAHPTYATGFAVAREPLSTCVFPEVILGLGSVPLADYATPSTGEVAKSLEPYIEGANAILLANHGVVAYGKDPLDAYFKMEKVEHAAHITFVARLLGGEKILSAEDVEKLRAISGQAYGLDPSGKLACEPGEGRGAASTGPASDSPSPVDDILEVVRQMINRGAK
jgi:L-fuculose-phosphate aldolase